MSAVTYYADYLLKSEEATTLYVMQFLRYMDICAGGMAVHHIQRRNLPVEKWTACLNARLQRSFLSANYNNRRRHLDLWSTFIVFAGSENYVPQLIILKVSL